VNNLALQTPDFDKTDDSWRFINNNYRKEGIMKNFYLGIDVSKGYADFVILDEKKQLIDENFQLDDTGKGHTSLYEKLSQFFQNNPESMINAAVESTGGYENNWFEAIHNFQRIFNIRIARLNPLGVHANSKADFKRNVTDKISARSVAEFMIAHPEKVTFQEQDGMASLRKQWVFAKMLTKQSSQLLNQLETLIYTANPEILRYCKDGMADWFLKTLLRYPTALELSKTNVKSLSQIPYVTKERAGELIAQAKTSVASASDDITAQLITATVEQLMSLKQAIKRQTELMIKKCSIPEIALLKSFTGISDYSAIGLMLEIVSVKRFSSAKKLASYFGIHPVMKTSGDGSSKPRMSKQGRKEPRQILFMVTLAAIQKNSLIKDIYQERLKKGMSKMAAIGYCMHKILRIIYGMLKHNKSFDPEIDKKNRQKKVNEKPIVRRDKNRRYQDYDPQAPISRRQHKKRMEQKESQSVNNTSNGIISAVPASV
jgi:transposase